ncbi:MAG: methyltransferase domain-containing protein, partial [Rhabdochlamydiaceae bacterium]
DYCKAQHIHDSYVKKDVRKITFSNKSFDTVICLQVVEHLTKKEAWDMVKKFEKIAKRQIIISTPIGHLDHDEVDGNHLQLHKCFFYPEDFEKKGYTVIKTGRKGLYGNNGLVHKLPSPLHRLVFVLDVLLVPFYRALPNFGNYHFYAYKNLVNK